MHAWAESINFLTERLLPTPRQMVGRGGSGGGGGKRGLFPALSRQVLSVSSWFRIPEQVRVCKRRELSMDGWMDGILSIVCVPCTTLTVGYTHTYAFVCTNRA